MNEKPTAEAASELNDGLGGLKPSAYLAWRCQWHNSEAAAYSAWKEIQYLHAGLDRYRQALEKIRREMHESGVNCWNHTIDKALDA